MSVTRYITGKQCSYIRDLLRKASMSLDFIDRGHVQLPHCDIKYEHEAVELWLQNLSIREASDVIEFLKDLITDGKEYCLDDSIASLRWPELGPGEVP